MKTIKNNYSHEIEIKNSKFITLLIKINDSNVTDILEAIKKEYPKATHYCYGYVYGSIKKSSDDGEPSGTAGFPILNVIEKENLNNILIVVVRYFGGIKLGAGGLVRAYTKSVTEALKECELVNMEEGYKIEIICDYSDEKQINYLLNDSSIISKNYDEKVSLIVLVNKDTLSKLSNYSYNILEELYIEKDS